MCSRGLPEELVCCLVTLAAHTGQFDAYSFGLFTDLNCGCQTPLQFSVCGRGDRESWYVARIAMAAYTERTEIDCN